MPLHDVAAQSAVHRGGALQIDRAAYCKCGQARTIERLGHNIGAEISVRKHVDHSQTHPVDSN